MPSTLTVDMAQDHDRSLPMCGGAWAMLMRKPGIASWRGRGHHGPNCKLHARLSTAKCAPALAHVWLYTSSRANGQRSLPVWPCRPAPSSAGLTGTALKHCTRAIERRPSHARACDDVQGTSSKTRGRIQVYVYREDASELALNAVQRYDARSQQEWGKRR